MPSVEFEEGEEPVRLDENTRNIVAVDGIPKAPLTKFEKLSNLIRKTFSRYGRIVEDYIPFDEETQTTLGSAFIEYETNEEAAIAVREANNFQFDKKHTFLVTLYSEFDNILSYREDYEPPSRSEFQMHDNLQTWLLDEKCRDQFVLRYAGETQVNWHEPLLNAGVSPVYGGERHKESGKNWTESYVAWSPMGQYLATFHAQGIMLWGGDDFRNLGRFSHPDVKLLEFSPCERYLVTFNGIETVAKGDPDCISVFDIRSGKKLRGFEGGYSLTQQKRWPIFKWSHDGKYVARLGKDVISVYETPSMNMLGKKSIRADRAVDFEWSPSQHIISYWSPEKDNIPASVSLIEVPSRKRIREKHLFNVEDVRIHWQKKGDYLCVKVARRRSGSRLKVTSTNFEIFRMREKNIPNDVLELTDPIMAFAWEPRGHRFAIVHGTGQAQKYNVSFYMLKKNKLKLEETLEPRLVNALFWSPTGNNIILAGMGALNGVLEFYDVNRKCSLAVDEHFMCTDVEWASSGLYVATAVSQPINATDAWRYSMENGYKIWTFQGQTITHSPTETFHQFLWRPMPPTLLSPAQKAEIRKTLRDKYYKRFEDEDEVVRQSQMSVEARARTAGRIWYKEYRAECARLYAEQAQARRELRGGYASDDDDQFDIDEIKEEEQIGVQEQVVS